MELNSLTPNTADPKIGNSYKRVPTIDLEREQEGNSKQKSSWFNLKTYFCDFCDNTSIHGWKFFGEQERYVVEKLWWFIVIFLAIYGSTTFILKTYKKWDSSPVIVTFATTETPIWKIPFPAVTICPSTKSNITAFNITSALLKENSTAEEQSFLDLFSMICPGMLMAPSANATKYMEETEFFDFIWEYLYQLDLDECKWMGNDEDCQSLFTKNLKPDGVCYTFNMLKMGSLYTNPLNLIEFDFGTSEIANWSLENGYESTAGLNAFPKRTFIASTKGGLYLQQCVERKELDYMCSDVQGYKVILHHPAEEPDMDRHFWLPLNQVVMAAVKPKMIVTSKDIESYQPEKRGCYIPGEKTLSGYLYYTQQNCMTECISNYTKAECGCVPFYNIHLHGYLDDFDVCAGGKLNCVEAAKVQFMSEEVQRRIHSSESAMDQCNCLPSCTSLEFDAETSQINWEWHTSLEKIGWDDESLDCSRLYIYYKDMQFMSSERHELYGMVDFLANCGGLLGLFCGFSFTSAMEILYYLTLRLICNLTKFGRRYWSGVKSD